MSTGIDKSSFFNEHAGAAAFFTFKNDQAKIVMVNNRYFTATRQSKGMDSMVHTDPMSKYDQENRAKYVAAIQKVIKTGEEQTCEVWRDYFSPCCGQDKFCLRARISLISKNNDEYLLVSQLEDITEQLDELKRITDSEAKFRNAAEQANIYAWEYNIATKEMRPCVRCMRDLGLPAVVKDYPEPLIESGLFPPDYADMYREWMQRLAEGESNLEAVIPLTADRIPFLVRYTTEYNQLGKPIKAYGSATMVVEPKDKLAQAQELLQGLVAAVEEKKGSPLEADQRARLEQAKDNMLAVLTELAKKE